jgi:hypothetical protein
MDKQRVREKVIEVRKCVRILETEIERQDNYQIGAALWKLNQQIDILYQLVHLGDRSQDDKR